jgi:vitamin B12 transporter
MIKNNDARCGIGCLCFAFAIGIAALFPWSLYAQIDTVKSKQLHEVHIKAKKLDLLQSSPTPVQVLSGEALRRINGLAVADAVRYFSGVQLKDYGGIGGLKTINVRSMGSNHTSVFYDGIQLGNAQNGQVDLGKFSLTNLDEIALYSGQKASQLLPAKSYAAASSLYLRTAAPIFSNEKPRNFKASLKSGSFGLINPSLSFQQKITNSLSFDIGSELLNAHGKYHYRYTNGVYDTTIVRHNADVYSKRIEAGLYWKTKDSSNFRLKFYNYNSERGIPGAIVANKFDFLQRQWDDNLFLQTSFQSSENKKFQYLINAKYAYDFTRYIDPTIISLTGILDQKYTQQEAYFSVANHYSITSIWSVSLAADYSFQKLSANLQYFSYPVRHTELLVLGTSLNWNRFMLQGNVLTTLVNEKVKNYLPAANKIEYTPTVMSSWQPFSLTDLRFRAFYKSIFRMPTFNDLYYTFIGNTNLKPEYTNQYNIGITYGKYLKGKRIQLNIQADAYSNEVKDKIVAVPTVNLFRWTMLNLDAVEIRGLETIIQLKTQFGEVETNAKIGYTYEKAIDQTKNGYTKGQQIPYIPIHSGSATLGITFQDYSFNYSYCYTGERYSQKANIPENYVPAWYTHDLAMRKDLNWRKINYRIGLEVNNLFNQYYDVVLNYPMPGRNFKISLNTNF